MKHKIYEWTARYIPAELVAIVGTVIGGYTIHLMFHNQVATALGGTWGENAGYYSYILWQEVRARKSKDSRLTPTGIFKIFRNMLVEFGPAEYLDSFVVRPTMMYMFQSMLSNLVYGLIVGKLSADLLFYCITIFFYEFRKKHLND